MYYCSSEGRGWNIWCRPLLFYVYGKAWVQISDTTAILVNSYDLYDHELPY